MKLAIITGGSTGLGLALVEQYSNAGFQVVEFSRSGTSAGHVYADLADPVASAQAMDARFATLAKYNYDALVYISNAGLIGPIGPVSAFTPSDWQRNLHVNLVSAITGMGLFLQHFQQHEGDKVLANISSGAARAAVSGWSLYCGAKAGLENFISTVAVEQEAQAKPIRAINIDPDIVDTPMQEQIRQADPVLFPPLERFQTYKASGALRAPRRVAAQIKQIIDQQPVNGTRYAVAMLDDPL